MNDDKLNLESENNHSSFGTDITGDVNTGGGDFIGRDQVIHGYSSEQVSELLEQIRQKFQPKPFDGRSPYIGLDSFQEEDVDRFFGRDMLVDELLERLTTSQFVMLTGPSGSGKSSVIQAGLIPKLRKGIIQESDRWLYATSRPGRDPLASLGRAMAGLVGQSSVVKEFQEQGLVNYHLLADWTEIALSDQSRHKILLVIDQFEEIFTQLSDKEEPIRAAFLRQIENAYTVETNKTIFILAMRSDFIGQCAAYPGLNALINQQFLQVGAMSQDELVSAIARPALEVGLRIDPDLVEQVLSDMRDQSGSLPLMQFAMADLFHAEQESGGVVELTLERYLDLGGLSHALERHADAAFARLSPSEQELARQVFKGLVQPGFGTVDTARTARFNELEKQGSNPKEVNAVVHKLADARLVTTDESTDDEPTVRLVHERLLEAWPWLTRLVNENREAISIQNEIQQDASLWELNEYDESYLYTGARLETARERLEEKKIHLNEIAASFVEAGIQRKLADQQEKEEQQRRELESAQELAEEQQARADEQTAAATRIRRRAIVITMVGVVAIVFAILAGIFYFNSQINLAASQANEATANAASNLADANAATAEANAEEARIQASNARARELATLASNVPSRKFDLAILLSVEAYRLMDLHQTRQTLFDIWNRTRYLTRLLSGHTDWVTSVAWSPDGRLASSSEDGTVILWDLEGGGSETILEKEADITIAWSLDGRLALGLDDGTIIIRDLESGEPDFQLMEHSSSINSIAWSPDGRLASVSSKRIIIWDLESKSIEKQINWFYDSTIESVAWSQDGRLASGSSNGDTVIWSLKSLEPELWLIGHSAWVESLAWSPEGRLASGSLDDTVIVWDLEDQSPELILRGHTKWVENVAWSTDGWLASGSGDGTVIVWDLENGLPRVTLEGSSGGVSSVAWSPDSLLAMGSGDGTVTIWDLEGGDSELILEGPGASNVAWSADGRIASGSGNGNVIVWNLDRQEPELILAGHSEVVNGVAWSVDGRLASVSGDGNVIIWDLVSVEPELILEGHNDWVNSVAWSSDGRLASGSDDGTVIVWDLEIGEPEVILERHTNGISSVAWSPDGRLASGSSDSTIIVWNLESEEPELILDLFSERVNSVAWSPDGRLISSSLDGSLIVWDLESEEPEMILEGDSAGVGSVAWSPDGRLASGSVDGNIIIWDLASGIPEMTLEGPSDDWVLSLAWSRDGWLASGFRSRNSPIILWEINFDVWINQVCQRAGRNFTMDEWDIYFPGEPYRKTCDQWFLETQ